MKLKKKKIHIELRQFCLIYFPESTHSMELRMTNFTGYTYFISLNRSRNRKGTLFVSFLFLILFSLILLYVTIYVVCCARIYPVQTMLSDSCRYFFSVCNWKWLMLHVWCKVLRKEIQNQEIYHFWFQIVIKSIVCMGCTKTGVQTHRIFFFNCNNKLARIAS